MAKSQRLERIENEVGALGYYLARQYVILSADGYVEESFSSLDEVERWLGCEELKRLGDAGGVMMSANRNCFPRVPRL